MHNEVFCVYLVMKNKNKKKWGVVWGTTGESILSIQHKSKIQIKPYCSISYKLGRLHKINLI